ncbi:hypothetical protein [Mangrovicoccus sp. HB161399]|uniref:hypothetical protein n=1 Tax=Mangrovicoccus sp. HB161399 TaxID=2720392 RepID=UPI001556805B|nr:hypothetical protein [Mangrovicoccus sp. HB161399]
MIDVECIESVRVRARAEPDPAQQRVLICFSGVNHRMGGMAVQRPEFFRSGEAFDNMLFIDDLDRSWGNHIDFAAMFARLEPYLAGRRVFCMGNSMGGFNAVLATNYIEVETCLAVVPRFTVHPDYDLPDGEDRPYLEQIREWRFRTIEDRFNDTTVYKVLSGSSSTESCHTALFPVKPNLHHYVLRPTNHGLAIAMKQQGVLPELIGGAWDGRMSASWIEALTGKKVTVLSGPERPPAAALAAARLRGLAGSGLRRLISVVR